VINLGIKQPIADILKAAEEYRADAIGMSGLLVKSTVVMKDNLVEMSRQGIGLPVMLGGAALTRAYVEDDCVKTYACGRVAYARDAFDGLDLMNKVVNGNFDSHLGERQTLRQNKPTNRKRRLGEASAAALRLVADSGQIRARRAELSRLHRVPTPPFWGPRALEAVPMRTLIPYLNEMTLYQFQWGFKKAGRKRQEFQKWAEQELKPILARVLALAEERQILEPQAVYGYWRAAAEDNDLILFEEDGASEVARFHLPRQADGDGLSIADYVRDVTDNERDVVGLQVVTMGAKASATAREWFEGDRYQDYLYLHGLSVEMAEAMAEYVHKRIRAELGYAGEESREREGLLKQVYRGSRYSFGYPACPNLADQRQLLSLLGARRIGVTLSEEDQLEPEQSTSALVILHPKAKYFSV
jgi:5-methyltetrahydrofolate--homocysteine methyltransferase